jgi:hypothetical protein
MELPMRNWAWLAALWIGACGSDPATFDAGELHDGAADTVARSDAPNEGGRCVAAWEELGHPIDLVSTGDVVVLANTAGKKTLYVDASAGGVDAASMNPRLYLGLETATRIDVTDRTARTSTTWDLAIKRPIFFTNGGDGGPGAGGAVFLADEDFDTVTKDHANAQTFASEAFFENDCTPKLDATGAVRTSFDEWYDYDLSNNTLAPKPGTWLVRGGAGKLYKIRILTYYATPDGGAGQAGGRYTLDVGAL